MWIGADSFAFAGMGAQVTAVDADEVTAAIASFNLRHLANASVEHARAEDIDTTDFDALWFDPARRTVGKGSKSGSTARIFDPEDFSRSCPGSSTRRSRRRLQGSNSDPHSTTPSSPTKQRRSGSPTEARSSRSASISEPPGSAPAAAPSRWATAPFSSTKMICLPRMRRVSANSASTSSNPTGRSCAPDSSLHCADRCRLAESTRDRLPDHRCRTHRPCFGRVTRDEVTDALPAKIPSLRKALISRGIGKVVIKKRGADIVPDQVRRQLKLPAGDKATLVFTRLGDRHVVLLTQPC